MLLPETLAARLTLGIIFLIAGLSKASSISSFTIAILEYQLLSGTQAKIVASVLPFVEIAIGMLCITGITLLAASSAAIFSLVLFTIAIIINLRRGRRFNCQCFGSSSAPIGPIIVIRNLLLITVSTFLGFQSFFSPFTPGKNQWQSDIQLLIHMNTFAPILSSVALSLSILFLLNETDIVLSTE